MPPENPYRVVLVAGNFDKRNQIHARLEGGPPKTVTGDYLTELAAVIKNTYGVDVLHVFSSPVKIEQDGQTLWDGIVEVFALVRHLDSNRCYAWGHRKENGGWDITTVLAVAPIISPESAVRAMISRSPTKS